MHKSDTVRYFPGLARYNEECRALKSMQETTEREKCKEESEKCVGGRIWVCMLSVVYV